MGWPRFVGSLNGQVSFVNEPYKIGALLQKRPENLGSLQIVASPYTKKLKRYN